VTSEARVPHITYEQPEVDWQPANAFQKSTFEKRRFAVRKTGTKLFIKWNLTVLEEPETEIDLISFATEKFVSILNF
jgi:hypothetical protein